MKQFLHDFRLFISRGSVLDLAVGVMIGAAFKAIVDSLVKDVISPVLGLLSNERLESLVWEIGSVQIAYGAFLTAVIDFLLMAFVLFLVVRAAARARAFRERLEKREAAEAAPAPETKCCPYCKMEIAPDATRCPHCTSVLE